MSQDTPNNLPPQWQQPSSQPLPHSPYPQQPPQYPPSQSPMRPPMQQPPQYPSSQPPMQQPQQPQKPRKPLSRGIKIGCGAVVAIVVLVVIIVIASTIATAGGNKGGTSTTNTQATQPATQAPTHVSQPTPKPTASFLHFGDGTYQVGKDIQPGTYRTRTSSPGCYYARLNGFGGTTGEIIANNNTDAPAIVTIAATDKGFESQSCGTWTKDLSQITTSKTTFSDGMYIIGTDIAPGTYRNTGVSGCYYARLSGFGNTIGDIIANNNVDTATIVTIASSDKGFQSNGCGTWTKQ